MKNRPMCLLATVLVLAVVLAGRWGLSWIWRGPGSARLEQMARDGTPAAAWGIVEKREEKNLYYLSYHQKCKSDCSVGKISCQKTEMRSGSRGIL